MRATAKNYLNNYNRTIIVIGLRTVNEDMMIETNVQTNIHIKDKY